MNKYNKVFVKAISMFIIIICVVFLQKIMSMYPSSFPNPILFIIMFSALFVYFYNTD